MPNAHSLRRTIAGLFALLLLSAVCTAAQAGPPHNVYVALTAKCRVANSFGGAGPLVAGVDRNINVTNAASYAAQGGTGSVGGGNSSLGCGIPDSVSALMISTSVIPRGTAGTLKVFMAGMTAADGNTVAFNSVDATTNDMVVPARSTDTTAEITINSSRATDYILDVVGYFTLPTQPELECTDSAPFTPTIAAGSTSLAFASSCPEGYLQTGIYCDSSSADMPLLSQTPTACKVRNNGTASATVTVTRRCCRVKSLGF